MGNTRCFDPSKNLPEPGSSICSDPNCFRCHDTGKYFVLDEPLPITKWNPKEHPDHPVRIQRKEVVCLKPAIEGDFDFYLRSILYKAFCDRMQILPDPRSPEETRISMDLKYLLDERR